jgi:hypothetical protein
MDKPHCLGSKKLSTLCYLIRNIKPHLSISMLRMIYHTLFHSKSYGIIFWGNSPHSSVIFEIQKRVIRTMMGFGYREPCGKLFVELQTLPLASQYLPSLLLFVVNNRDYFTPNSAHHTAIWDMRTTYTYPRRHWPCIRKQIALKFFFANTLIL